MRILLCAAAFAAMLTCGSHFANAQVRITEWMYSGAEGEFFELTNVGGVSVDLTGWSYDDDSQTPGVLDLSPLGTLAVGESAVVTESVATDFRTAWSIPAAVKILGEYMNNLGRNDEINIFDASNSLVDRLTYGDQDFPGTIRTQNASGNPATPAALGANDPAQWVLSSVGDAYGSYESTNFDVGNPGIYRAIPEPTGLALAVLSLVGLLNRRRG